MGAMICGKYSRTGTPCDAENFTLVTCDQCGRQYQRCANHGGAAGGRKSLGAHKGICPKRPMALLPWSDRP